MVKKKTTAQKMIRYGVRGTDIIRREPLSAYEERWIGGQTKEISKRFTKRKSSLKGRTTPPGACGSAWEARCIMDDPKGWKWECNIYPRGAEVYETCSIAIIDTSKKPASIVFKDVK